MVLDGIEILKETLKVEYKYNEGIKVAEENGKFVALDNTIDDKLYEEFMYRKLLRQCQVARKEADFDVVDRISLNIVTSDSKVKEMLENYKDSIAHETLATLSFEKTKDFDYEKEIDILESKVLLQLKKK